ncbi:MAG TPA: extracellular solute-binding protein [Propionicimonas sp.]|jgi:ABC-type glycerol-3-phosphate transport system substrate-binding protein
MSCSSEPRAGSGRSGPVFRALPGIFRVHRGRRAVIAAAAVGSAAVLALAGCGTGTGAPTATGGTGATGSAAPASDVTITMWHYFTDRADLLQKFADEYKQQTGVTVKVELISSGDTLGQKFQAAAQAKTLPDISAAWTGIGDGLAPYAKEGLIANLSGQLDAAPWKANLSDSEVAAVSFPSGNNYGVQPGPYLVPIDSNNMQFLYNKDLFTKAGIARPPTTWADFLADGKKLAAIGVAPFVAGLGSWPVDSLAQVYMWNIIGQQQLEATFSGSQLYTAQPWIDFLTTFDQLRQAKVLADGALADDDPAAESLFVHGQAGMLFDGSWAIGVFNQQDPSFQNYGVFFPPSAGNFPVKIPGGVGAQAFVVGTSPHVAEATAFLKWLTDGPQQATYANGSFNLPANPTVASQQSLSPNLKSFSEKMDSLIPALATGMPAAVDTTMQKGIQAILAGTSTPAAVAASMQKAATTGQVQ